MSKLRLALCRRDDLDVPDGQCWLLPSECDRLRAFSASSRRKSFLAGRWLLRELLAQTLGGGPQQHGIEIDEQGRSKPELGFANLSHSGVWCVAAWSEAPVGVDVEVIRPRVDLLALAERATSKRELAQLGALAEPERLRAFYSLWTLKEASLKSQGLGLDFKLMRELEFESTVSGGDAACVHLPRACLQLALYGTALDSLPTRLAAEDLAWQQYRRRGA